jgi:hypothetical protein
MHDGKAASTDRELPAALGCGLNLPGGRIDNSHLESSVESRGATSTRPCPLPAAAYGQTTAGALVDILHRSPIDRFERRPDVVQGGAGDTGYPNRNPIVSMMCVASEITVEMVAHMNQLLGHNDFQCARLFQVNALGIDQDCVFSGSLQETIRTAI